MPDIFTGARGQRDRTAVGGVVRLLGAARRLPAPPWIRPDLGPCLEPPRARVLANALRPRVRTNTIHEILRATLRPQPTDQHVGAHLCGRDLCIAPPHLLWLSRSELRQFSARFLVHARRHDLDSARGNLHSILWVPELRIIADHVDALGFIRPSSSR